MTWAELRLACVVALLDAGDGQEADEGRMHEPLAKRVRSTIADTPTNPWTATEPTATVASTALDAMSRRPGGSSGALLRAGVAAKRSCLGTSA